MLDWYFVHGKFCCSSSRDSLKKKNEKPTQKWRIPYGKAGSDVRHVKPVALFCQGYIKHGQDCQGSCWWEKKRCTVSYVMQQNHRQGNCRSNVLTSSASLCPLEHLELLKWANIVLRKKKKTLSCWWPSRCLWIFCEYNFFIVWRTVEICEWLRTR